MNRRHDALAAAARELLVVRDVVRAESGRQVGTVRYMKAEPGAPNVIPGRVEFPFELRDLDAAKIERMSGLIQEQFVNTAPAGLSSTDLPSGAVHDAGEISRIAPMGMIFVPSRDASAMLRVPEHSPSPDQQYSRDKCQIQPVQCAAAVARRSDGERA